MNKSNWWNGKPGIIERRKEHFCFLSVSLCRHLPRAKGNYLLDGGREHLWAIRVLREAPEISAPCGASGYSFAPSTTYAPIRRNVLTDWNHSYLKVDGGPTKKSDRPACQVTSCGRKFFVNRLCFRFEVFHQANI